MFITYDRKLMAFGQVTEFNIDFNFYIQMVILNDFIYLCKDLAWKNVSFFNQGVRQEQDIFVRLIDSVTKQVIFYFKELIKSWRCLITLWEENRKNESKKPRILLQKV